jgi:hypothetical protein
MYVVERYAGIRGSKRARMAIDLMDAVAQSPKENWLRSALIDAGFPGPTTRIRVTDDHLVAYLDMRWTSRRCRMPCHLPRRPTSHRSRQYVKDIGPAGDGRRPGMARDQSDQGGSAKRSRLAGTESSRPSQLRTAVTKQKPRSSRSLTSQPWLLSRGYL